MAGGAEGGRTSETVCVTGAGGYIASWLVKLLLARGYSVHGTVRDLGDEKTGHLRRLENAGENLKLFKADLLEYDAMAAAVAGCQGIFHVATPVPSKQLVDPEAKETFSYTLRLLRFTVCRREHFAKKLINATIYPT